MPWKIKHGYYLLAVILLISAFLRFYRLLEMAALDFDQQYAANFAYSVLKIFPLQLIGQGLSVEGLYMGPLYFYFLVPFYAVFNLHPIGGAVGSVVLGLVTVVVYFWVAKELFGFTAGLIAAFLRGVHFSFLNTDWSTVPAFSSDLVVLLTWLFFYKYWHGQTIYLPLLAFIFGIYTSFHPILFPFYIVFIILLIIKRKLPRIKIFLASIIAFILPLAPLILFEYWHNFLEVKRLFSYYGDSTSQNRDWDRFYDYLQLAINSPYDLLSAPYLPKQALLILFYALIVYLIYKKWGFWKDNFHKITLTITFLVFMLYYTFLPSHVPEYYLLAIPTLITLYISGVLSFLTTKPKLALILILVLVNIAFFNMKQLIKDKWNYPSSITLYHKDFIVKEILKRQPKDQEFFVSYIKEPGWNFGFDYLFKLYGQIPQTKEVKPPIYTIVIPKSLSPDAIDVSSGNIGLILPD